MPRKTTKDAPVVPISGIGQFPDKLTVQKSKPLTALWQSDLSLAEFKLLDAYLARIDSHKPEMRSVRFEKGEIERLLGVKKINLTDLKSRVLHLMTPLSIDNGPNDFLGLCLFSIARCSADANGIWQVDLCCTPEAMQYFFDIEHIGYLRYKLRCIAGLTSRYSYILFLYLEMNRFRKSWEVTLDDLKTMLKCDNIPTYQQFKDFNKLLLKRCQNEIHEKTECRFEYVPVKKGRIVTAIRFTLESLAMELPDPDQMTFDDSIPPDDLLRSAVPEFSGAEFDAIWEVLVTVPDNKLPYNVGMYDRNGDPDITFRRYHYLSQKIQMLNAADERAAKRGRPIKNRFAYFLKMLRTDAAPEGD